MISSLLSSRAVLLGLVALALSGGSASAQSLPGAAPQLAQAAKPTLASIATVDLGVVLQNSAAGRSIREQIDKQGQVYQSDLTKRQADLQKLQASLAAQQATLTPEAFAGKRRAFEDDVNALQRQTDDRKDQLQRASDEAMKTVQTSIMEILKQEKTEHGVQMIAQSGAIAMGDPGFDLTSELLQRLDAKLPRVAVKLGPLPTAKR